MAPVRLIQLSLFAPIALVGAISMVACGPDRPVAAPERPATEAVMIPSQPDAGTASSATAPDDAERARVRAEFDRVAEEKRKLEDSVAGSPPEPADGKDPTGGNFTLADATATLPGTGGLAATIKTSKGEMKCKLFDDKAPNTVANFVGLARGVRPFKAHVDGRWVKQPLYDGTTFHRVIKGFMIQGGDPQGNGMGEPGYVINDEIWPGAKHDRAGLLCMANRGRNTNGAQFFITDASVPHLDGNYTIFGECSPVSVVHAIAGVPKGVGDRPATPITIDKVTITRDASSKPGAPKPKPGPEDRH